MTKQGFLLPGTVKANPSPTENNSMSSMTQADPCTSEHVRGGF